MCGGGGGGEEEVKKERQRDREGQGERDREIEAKRERRIRDGQTLALCIRQRPKQTVVQTDSELIQKLGRLTLRGGRKTDRQTLRREDRNRDRRRMKTKTYREIH